MIRETIKEALIARNMTRKELARLAGCRINTITDYLNAKSEMRSDLLTKVFEIMKIKIGGSDITRSDERKKGPGWKVTGKRKNPTALP